jgi:hypothetical protein
MEKASTLSEKDERNEFRIYGPHARAVRSWYNSTVHGDAPANGGRGELNYSSSRAPRPKSQAGAITGKGERMMPEKSTVAIVASNSAGGSNYAISGLRRRREVA